MFKFFRDMLTEVNNETFCILRVGAALVILVGLGLEIYKAMHPSVDFDIEHYGIGGGSILAAAGAALKFKPETAA